MFFARFFTKPCCVALDVDDVEITHQAVVEPRRAPRDREQKGRDGVAADAAEPRRGPNAVPLHEVRDDLGALLQRENVHEPCLPRRHGPCFSV